MNNTISIKETSEHLEINIKMQTIMPCINSIKQYKPSFKAQDIVKEKKSFKGSLYDHIEEYFETMLYEEIENNRGSDAE